MRAHETIPGTTAETIPGTTLGTIPEIIPETIPETTPPHPKQGREDQLGRWVVRQERLETGTHPAVGHRGASIPTLILGSEDTDPRVSGEREGRPPPPLVVLGAPVTPRVTNQTLNQSVTKTEPEVDNCRDKCYL